jgi:transcriptional regulator with XRE-family HTH domain
MTEGDRPVGVELAALRHAAGLTGQELAQRVGLSQATISRIETGTGRLRPRIVERMARALQASDAQIADLVRRAQPARADDRMTEWRSSRGAVPNMQNEVAQLEASTTLFRVFQPAVIVGLAQSSEYARSVLGEAHELRAKVDSSVTVAAVPEAVSARVQRQVILADPAKRFHFLMLEAVLSNRLGSPRDMPAQIERLREISRQDNVTMRFIPTGVKLAVAPYHGFEVLDDRLVIADLYNTSVRTSGRRDVALYQEVFEKLDESATSDIDAILDKHLDIYLDLSRPHRQ